MTKQISEAAVQHPGSLARLLNAFDDEIDAVRTLVNELKTDHATNIAVIADLKTLVNDVRSQLQGDYILTSPALAIGSTTTAVANGAFDYVINGVPYKKAAVTTGTAPGNDVIPQSTYGAVAFDIDAAGTITAVEATDNATGYASAALAAAGLPATTADNARMGYVTATKSDGAFTFGTTALNAANTTVAYTEGNSPFVAIGSAVSSSPAATVSASAVTEQVEGGK